jgi:Bardet-Biedl syndrome 7 protein
MDTFDMTKDGKADILVGRDDGAVQVYSFDISPEPMLQFEKNVVESIRSIQVGRSIAVDAACHNKIPRFVQSGCISSLGFEEIVVCSYAGKVVSFTNEELHKADEEVTHHLCGNVNPANKLTCT